MKIATLKGGPWAASTLRVVHDGTTCSECRQRPPQALWNGLYPVCLPCAEAIAGEIAAKQEKARA